MLALFRLLRAQEYRELGFGLLEPCWGWQNLTGVMMCVLQGLKRIKQAHRSWCSGPSDQSYWPRSLPVTYLPNLGQQFAGVETAAAYYIVWAMEKVQHRSSEVLH